MAKITKLTADQEVALVEWRKRWLQVGICCEPADFDRAEEVITDFYRRLGKARPMFFRFSSPMMCELGIAALKALLKDRGQLWGQLGDQLGDQLRDQLGGQLRDQLRDQLGGQLEGQLGDQLRGQLRDQLGDQLGDQLRDQLGGQLWDQLWGQLGDQLWDQLGDQLWDQLWGQLGDQLWDQLWDQLGDQLGGQLRDQLGKLEFTRNAFWGQHEAYWVAFYGFAVEIGVKYGDELQLLNAWGTLAESSCWWAPWEGICVLSDRPRHVAFDAAGRLHDDNGMAVRFADGWGVHAVHGTRVPGWIVERPQDITPAKIQAEGNAEVKRVMIERYGVARYMADSGGRVIDQCSTDHPLVGLRGARLLAMQHDGYEQPLTVIELVNSTPEPDDSEPKGPPVFRLYHLSVNPAHYGGRAGRECLAAAASTWRDPMDTSRLIFARPEDYAPAAES